MALTYCKCYMVIHDAQINKCYHTHSFTSTPTSIDQSQQCYKLTVSHQHKGVSPDDGLPVTFQ